MTERGLGYVDTHSVTGVTGWETETVAGQSVYRHGPESRVETHRVHSSRGLTVSVGWRDRPARDTLSVTLEEAELLALALTEAVLRAAGEQREEDL